MNRRTLIGAIFATLFLIATLAGCDTTNWTDPVTGLNYVIKAEVESSDPDEIQAEMNRIKSEYSLNATNRGIVLVPPGTYNLNAELSAVDGVDLRGSTGDPNDVIITYGGDNDTAEAGGVNSMWSSMTLEHTGTYVHYGLHVDRYTAQPDVELVLHNMIITSESKQGAGVGTRRSQQMFVYDTTFLHTGEAPDRAGFFWHNDSGGNRPARLVLDNVTATGGIGASFNQQNSGDDDKVYITDSSLVGNPGHDITIGTGTAGPQAWVDFYVDPNSYMTANVVNASSFQDLTGVTIPTPTRIPVRGTE